MAPNALKGYVFTEHARLEMQRRGLEEELVRTVLSSPGQRFPVRVGREVFQSVTHREGKAYLVRVFVDVDRSPAEVVTTYRSSRVAKYWREGS